MALDDFRRRGGGMPRARRRLSDAEPLGVSTVIGGEIVQHAACVGEGARTSDGKEIVSITEVVRWLIEQIEAAEPVTQGPKNGKRTGRSKANA